MKSAGLDQKRCKIFGDTVITMIPRNSELLGQLVTATQTPKAAAK